MGSATLKSPGEPNRLYSKPFPSSVGTGHTSIKKPVTEDAQVSAHLSTSALDTSRNASVSKAPPAPTTFTSYNQLLSKPSLPPSSTAKTSASMFHKPFPVRLHEKPATNTSSAGGLSGSFSNRGDGGGSKAGLGAGGATTARSEEEGERENKPRFWDRTFMDGGNKKDMEQNCKTQ